MRPVTKHEAVKEKPKARIVSEMGRNELFRVVGYTSWFRRTDERQWPYVSVNTGNLRSREWGRSEVTEVLAPGESLTIGPDEETR